MGDLIWYVCYGSNLLEERFRCYIQGGKPKGATKEYVGCTNRVFPSEKLVLKIPYELYFAKNSSTWNGGVAFIKSEVNDACCTYVKAYLITPEQFVQVYRQENSKDPNDTSLDIDFTKLNESKFFYGKSGWYKKVLYLGIDKYPMLTITGDWVDEVLVPSDAYLITIINGLIESHSLCDKQIIEYLKKCDGVSKSGNEIGDLISKCRGAG